MRGSFSQKRRYDLANRLFVGKVRAQCFLVAHRRTPPHQKKKKKNKQTKQNTKTTTTTNKQTKQNKTKQRMF